MSVKDPEALLYLVYISKLPKARLETLVFNNALSNASIQTILALYV